MVRKAAQSALGTPSCSLGSSTSWWVCGRVWNMQQSRSHLTVLSTGVQLQPFVQEGFSCLFFFWGGFFKCWLFFNFSSLVNFKIKYRTTRGLLSHCFTVCSKNSPFSLTAGSVLGHFYNLFSSSVSKLTRLSCFYHSCLGGCSKSLLLWELQASCNENVSPVLNSLTAICAFVLVPELSFQLKSFSLRMPQLCRCLSSRHLY